MKTAVFLRGHARTWCLTKENTLRMFGELYDDIDWYVAFVDTGTIDHSQLREDFKDCRLIASLLLDPDDYILPQSQDATKKWFYFNAAYWRLAWLDHFLGQHKRAHECKISAVYDNVIFIRPDVWYYVRQESQHKVVARLHTMSVAEIGTDGNLVDDWRVGDLVYRAGAAAADLLTLRYIDPYFTDAILPQLIHGNSLSNIAHYPVRRFIGHTDYSAIENCIIRPDHIDNWPFDAAKVDPTHRDSKTWHGLTAVEKLEYCQRLKISPLDYQLAT